jgi:hypothetical protein
MRLGTLGVQQTICESPQTATHRASRMTAAMLPDAATLDDPALSQKERDLRRVALELTARSGSCPDCGHFLHILAMSNNDVDTLVAYFDGDR